MSFAFRCDRCNEFIQNQPKIIRIHPEDEYKAHSYELCEICWDEFEQYLNNGKEK